jgi:hypothetical protein
MDSQELHQALISLGATPEQVYQSLKDQNIKGRPNSNCDCPIAKYLQTISGEDISVGSMDAYLGFEFVTYLPLAVQGFIRRFDSVFNYFEDLRS